MHIISMDDHKQYAVFIDDIKIAISKYSLYLSNILSVSKLYDLFIKKEKLKDREKIVQVLQWFSILLPFFQNNPTYINIITYLLDLSQLCKVYLDTQKLSEMNSFKILEIIYSKYKLNKLIDKEMNFDPLFIITNYNSIPFDLEAEKATLIPPDLKKKLISQVYNEFRSFENHPAYYKENIYYNNITIGVEFFHCKYVTDTYHMHLNNNVPGMPVKVVNFILKKRKNDKSCYILPD